MAPVITAHSAHSDDLHRLLEGRDTRWYRGRLAKLNLILLLLLITSCTNGYDGSMMNGLRESSITSQNGTPGKSADADRDSQVRPMRLFHPPY